MTEPDTTEPVEPRLDERAAGELDQLLNALGGRLAEEAPQDRRRSPALVRGAAVAVFAAVLAVLLFGIPGRRGGPPATFDTDTALTWDVSADQSFAVFPTTDDDMVIIWMLGENQ